MRNRQLQAPHVAACMFKKRPPDCTATPPAGTRVNFRSIWSQEQSEELAKFIHELDARRPAPLVLSPGYPISVHPTASQAAEAQSRGDIPSVIKEVRQAQMGRESGIIAA